MRANAERLHQRKLIERQSIRFVQQYKRHGKKFLHTPIHVDSEKPNVFAAIVPPHCAGPAFPAAHVRFNGTAISGLNALFIGRRFHDNSG